MKKARYIRQSSQTQKNYRQLAIAHPDEKLFIDVISGSIPFAERPEGKKLIEAVESGVYDFITFHDLSRAGRSTIDVLTTLSFFQSKGVIVKIDNLGLESIVNGKINPIFNLITTVLSEINALERTTLLERQAEGILQARLRGSYVGRTKGTTDSTEVTLSKHKKVVKELKTNPHLSLRKIGTLTGVSANTVKKIAGILQSQS
ncbi:recombinase family protein [Flavobacterium lacisediminis]|uniref:Recombinase family protein n=1 Tax=Flavobacterium lacisediminis TaxID=2989705 RepID=A0ABT3EHI3_9FLAO|nr:recombinase family protein [Flavobacterium lacisediminis]MCW1148039.1 recombinase family protein [Flavobacterium lacisediminis]